MTEQSKNKDLVFAAMDGILVEHSEASVDRYFHPDFIQHNPFAKDGNAHVKEMCAFTFGLEAARWAAQGDLVAYHGIYTAPNPLGNDPLLCVDVWRICGGQIIEHWDALQPIGQEQVQAHTGGGGRGDADVPAAAIGVHTARARRYFESVINGRNFAALDELLAPDFSLHQPGGNDGKAALQAWIRADDDTHVEVRRTIASGDLLFAHLLLTKGGTQQAVFDVLSFDDQARIRDLWTVAQPITPPAEAANAHPHF